MCCMFELCIKLCTEYNYNSIKHLITVSWYQRMKMLLQRSKLSQLVHVLLSSPLLAAGKIDIHVIKTRGCQNSCTRFVNGKTLIMYPTNLNVGHIKDRIYHFSSQNRT
jgi:hypothetical protein